MVNGADSASKARKILLDKHSFYGSWAAVAQDVGVNRGVLCSIANGKRTPSDNVLLAIGLQPHSVLVTPCAVCGSTRHKKHRNRKPDRSIRLSRIRKLLQSPYLTS